jgi:hypothetical protein
MRHLIGYLLFGLIGGPLILIGGGYVVAFWSVVLTFLAIAAGLFVLAVIVTALFQERAKPRFDADAAARAAFAPTGPNEIRPPGPTKSADRAQRNPPTGPNEIRRP